MPDVKVNGLRVHYKTTGRGEPIVLLSGLGTDQSAWALSQVPAFVAAGFMCVGVDNRDAGQSDKSPVEQYSIRDMADDAAAVLIDLGCGPVHALGASMGGMIAQELALAHPEMIQSLTLCCTDAGRSAAVRAWVKSLLIMRPKCDLRSFWQTLIPWCFGEAFLSQPGAQESVLDGVEANPHPQSSEAFIRQCGAILTHDTMDRLSDISAPTHVITGAEDIVHPARSAKVLTERIPGAELTIVPNVGHALCWEDPIGFNEAVLSFIARHPVTA